MAQAGAEAGKLPFFDKNMFKKNFAQKDSIIEEDKQSLAQKEPESFMSQLGGKIHQDRLQKDTEEWLAQHDENQLAETEHQDSWYDKIKNNSFAETKSADRKEADKSKNQLAETKKGAKKSHATSLLEIAKQGLPARKEAFAQNLKNRLS